MRSNHTKLIQLHPNHLIFSHKADAEINRSVLFECGRETWKHPFKHLKLSFQLSFHFSLFWAAQMNMEIQILSITSDKNLSLFI